MWGWRRGNPCPALESSRSRPTGNAGRRCDLLFLGPIEPGSRAYIPALPPSPSQLPSIPPCLSSSLSASLPPTTRFTPQPTRWQIAAGRMTRRSVLSRTSSGLARRKCSRSTEASDRLSINPGLQRQVLTPATQSITMKAPWTSTRTICPPKHASHEQNWRLIDAGYTTTSQHMTGTRSGRACYAVCPTLTLARRYSGQK